MNGFCILIFFANAFPMPSSNYWFFGDDIYNKNVYGYTEVIRGKIHPEQIMILDQKDVGMKIYLLLRKRTRGEKGRMASTCYIEEEDSQVELVPAQSQLFKKKMMI